MAEQILGLFCEPPIVIARLGGRQRRDCSSLSWGKTLLPDAGSANSRARGTKTEFGIK